MGLSYAAAMALFPQLTYAVIPTNTICITTAQEFQTALTPMSDGGSFAAQNNVINMAAGHYSIGSATNDGPFKYRSSSSSGSLQIAGGFNANCTVHTPDASFTVLDGLTQSQVFQGIIGANLLEIFMLTIQGGSTASNGAGLSINLTGRPSDEDYSEIEQVIFKNNKSLGSPLLWLQLQAFDRSAPLQFRKGSNLLLFDRMT
jgi:hypothetical protein